MHRNNVIQLFATERKHIITLRIDTSMDHPVQVVKVAAGGVEFKIIGEMALHGDVLRSALAELLVKL